VRKLKKRFDPLELREEKKMADDVRINREIVLEADAETLARMRKEGHARGFTVYCDEGARVGGENSAPPSWPSVERGRIAGRKQVTSPSSRTKKRIWSRRWN
jgi:hypothetical protein